MDWSVYIQTFVTLFAISNPVGAVPLFLGFTENLKKERQTIAKTTAMAVGAILIVTLVLGEFILDFFSISVDAFRVAGGILLMFIAFQMLHARHGRTRHTPEEDEEAQDADSVAIIPLAMPLIAGPGAISTVILYGNQAKTVIDSLLLAAICVVLATCIWSILRIAPLIEKRLSQTSINIMTRIMGLILAAMAVEFITGGLKTLLPGLTG